MHPLEIFTLMESMLTELKSPVVRPHALSNFPGKSLAAALTALKILLWRSMGMNEIAIEVRAGEGDAAAGFFTVHTSWEDNPTVAVALRRVNFALKKAVGDRDRPAGSEWPSGTPLECLRKNRQPIRRMPNGLRSPWKSSATSRSRRRFPTAVRNAVRCSTEERFWTILAGLESHGHLSVGELPLLTPGERDLLHRWSGEPHDASLARPELLHELFERQADLHAERTAVVCGEESLTYAELECQANRLAHRLRCARRGARDVRGDSCCGGRRKSMWRCWRSSRPARAYVPLDASYPADRVSYILNDCKVRAVVTTSEFAERHDLERISHDLVGRIGRRNFAGIRRGGCEIGYRRDERRFGLRDLHFRFDGPAEGRGRRASRGLQSGPRREPHLRSRAEDRVFQGFSTRSTPRSKKSGWPFSPAPRSWPAPRKSSTAVPIWRAI